MFSFFFYGVEYMTCKKCGGHNLYVVDSRPARNRIGVRRRRECADCGNRITTYEVTQEEYDLVIKSQKMLKKVVQMLDIYGQSGGGTDGDETK